MNNSKWQCPACTYENWPASTKCTMCLTPKSSTIEDEMLMLNLSESNQETQDYCHSETLPVNVHKSTVCPFCTYENKPDSFKCNQCFHVICDTPLPLPNNPSPSPSIQMATHSDQQKWTCPRCTYANWSKNRHCTMCHGTPPQFPCLTTQPVEVKPPPARRSKHALSTWLNACKAVLDNEIGPIERFYSLGGKLERRLTKSDRHYLLSLVKAPSGGSDEQPVDESSSSSSTSPQSEASADSTSLHIRSSLTLLDLAVRLNRTSLINSLVSLTSSSKLARRSESPSSPTGSKWVPCQASPDLARQLRLHLANSIGRGQDFPCLYLTAQPSTFSLPRAIANLPKAIRFMLISELCDTEAQSELEEDAKAINWWCLPGQRQPSRLFALWNRTAGDCLLDSVLQACWGVFDRDQTLRHTLAESLQRCESIFYTRWRGYEAMQAASHYTLDDNQCRRDWEKVMQAACQPGDSLEQIHIFALAHILRRPIIVYGVRFIKNYRDEPIGIANFQGIYLPLLWPNSVCSRNPIILGYTRGHFTALVSMETGSRSVVSSGKPSPPPPPPPPPTTSDPHQRPSSDPCPRPSTSDLGGTDSLSASASSTTVVDNDDQISGRVDETRLAAVSQSRAGGLSIYLPLIDKQGEPLPIHFITEKETIEPSASLLGRWLNLVYTRSRIPLVRQRLDPRPPLVGEMLDEWLASYCRHQQQSGRTSRPTSGPSDNSSLGSSRSSSPSLTDNV